MAQALDHNKSIEAAVASTESAETRITQAKSGSLPKVNYTESWSRSDNPVFVFSSLLTQRQFGESNFGIAKLNQPEFLNNFQSLLSAEQPLYDAGKTRRAVRMAELGRNAAAEEGRRIQSQVIADVARFYYDSQLRAEQAAITAQAMRSAEADLERAEATRVNGIATDADILSVRVHIAAIREEQIRRVAELEVSNAALNDAMGLPLGSTHSLTTKLAPLPIPRNELAGMERSAVEERAEARQTRLVSSCISSGTTVC